MDLAPASWKAFLREYTPSPMERGPIAVSQADRTTSCVEERLSAATSYAVSIPSSGLGELGFLLAPASRRQDSRRGFWYCVNFGAMNWPWVAIWRTALPGASLLKLVSEALLCVSMVAGWLEELFQVWVMDSTSIWVPGSGLAEKALVVGVYARA